MRTHYETTASEILNTTREVLQPVRELATVKPVLLVDVDALARDSYVLATVTLLSRGLPVVSTTRIIDRVGQFYTGVGHSAARDCDVRARVEAKGRATFAYRIVSFDPGEDLPEVISRVVR